MKKSVTLLFAVFGLMPLLSVPLAAQTFRMKADIPFAFAVNGRSMPAGEYAVSSDGFSQVLELRNTQSGTTVMAMANPAGNGYYVDHSAPELLFHRIGDHYFLWEAWDSGPENGCELNTSHEERSTAREMSAVQPQTVVILAKR